MIPEPWIVDGDGIAASSVIDSGSEPRRDGDGARETAPGRPADWTDVTSEGDGESWMEIREKRACRSARLNSRTYATRTCAPRIRRTRWKFESYIREFVAFFPDDCFILYRESQFARILEIAKFLIFYDRHSLNRNVHTFLITQNPQEFIIKIAWPYIK